MEERRVTFAWGHGKAMFCKLIGGKVPQDERERTDKVVAVVIQFGR